jgi:hypothetical protein
MNGYMQLLTSYPEFIQSSCHLFVDNDLLTFAFNYAYPSVFQVYSTRLPDDDGMGIHEYIESVLRSRKLSFFRLEALDNLNVLLLPFREPSRHASISIDGCLYNGMSCSGEEIGSILCGSELLRGKFSRAANSHGFSPIRHVRKKY